MLPSHSRQMERVTPNSVNGLPHLQVLAFPLQICACALSLCEEQSERQKPYGQLAARGLVQVLM